MSTVFKVFLNDDVAQTRTPLHEAIPVTGTIISGTYSDNNIKNYSHGIFQSVYDYPFLSSSANHLFDLTFGYSANSALSASTSEQNEKKINVYNQMAQILVGHDLTGSILEFDQDGDILAGGTKMKEVAFVSFARLLTKDEIKKGSFVFGLGTGSVYTAPFAGIETLRDQNAANEFRVNSPAGEYGILYTSSVGITEGTGVGLLYYQAGVAVITASVFDTGVGFSSSAEPIDNMLTASTIEELSDSLRHRYYDLDFNNTTELNSSIYFCRVNHNEFNYSSNPTYLSGSKINVKQNTFDEPVTYITSIGLYSADNELLASAKLSEPLKKTPSNEMVLRVRLDY
jgi:hypothetical protein